MKSLAGIVIAVDSSAMLNDFRHALRSLAKAPGLTTRRSCPSLSGSEPPPSSSTVMPLEFFF